MRSIRTARTTSAQRSTMRAVGSSRLSTSFTVTMLAKWMGERTHDDAREVAMDEITIKLSTKHLPGFRCPHCGGLGRMADGSFSIGPDEVRIKAATQCGVCMGKGRVRCVPITDEEDRAAQT